MKKPVLLFGAVVLILFAAITVLKSRPASTDHAEAAEERPTAEREAVRQFWVIYRQATEHRIAGRLDAATSAYQKALALNDEHEDALYYLGTMHLELGNLAEARAAWQRLARLSPHSARAHAQLGDLYFCRYQDAFFDLDAAEAAFTRALEINSEETGPLLRLGQIALVRGDRAQAQYYFDAVIGSNYKSIDAHVLKGYLAWKQGDATQGAALLAQAARYAQPEKPPQGVLGEGDTKEGTTPMVSGTSDCLVFAPFIHAVTDAPARPASPDTLYPELDAFLKQISR